MEFSKAKLIAESILEIFTPYCEPNRIHIAGSIRRELSMVKDIEIVAQPLKIFTPTDLFGGGTWSIVPEFNAAVEYITQDVVKG